MRRIVRAGAALVPCAAVAAAAWVAAMPVGAAPPGEAPEPPSGAAAVIRHYLRFGLAGHGGGRWDGGWRDLRDLPVHPGDVILCRAPGSVHGYWSHVTIALGDGRVLAHDVCAGLWIARVGDLGWYAEGRVLRPRGDGERAARAAAAMAGLPFNLLAHPRDPFQQTCAKAAVDAWAAAGVRIDDGRFWPTPGGIAAGDAAIVGGWR